MDPLTCGESEEWAPGEPWLRLMVHLGGGEEDEVKRLLNLGVS